MSNRKSPAMLTQQQHPASPAAATPQAMQQLYGHRNASDDSRKREEVDNRLIAAMADRKGENDAWMHNLFGAEPR